PAQRRCCTGTACGLGEWLLQAKRVAGGTRLGHAYLPLESEDSRKRCAPAPTVFGRSKANRKRLTSADQAALMFSETAGASAPSPLDGLDCERRRVAELPQKLRAADRLGGHVARHRLEQKIRELPDVV